MNFPSGSINNHYLSSFLPFQTVPAHKQFTKTKQFYKPQQFIWNNPHRTSKRMYPYFHQVNDNYQKKVKPIVQGFIELERSQIQSQRIRKLSQIRDQTRKRFHSRKQMRESLQNKANKKKQQNKTQQLKNGKGVKSLSYGFKSESKMKIPQEPQGRTATQQTYFKGLEQYDQKVLKMQQLFNKQFQDNYSKIRSQFKTRRQQNSIANSRIKNTHISFINSKIQ